MSLRVCLCFCVVHAIVISFNTSLLLFLCLPLLSLNKKGCYGSSLLLASPSADQNTKVVFKSPDLLSGKYTLYFYLPNLENNSTIFNWDIKQGSKKLTVQVKLDESKSTLKGEWISLGDFDFKTKNRAEAIVYSKGANGLVPADAILWVPIK